ncbi:MAG: sigma-54 dependent transcriptional regulator [Candidatus Omnitrophica bacterium]|nr:sigma-54 dependent transcriptional regulator [Candidatus Omnitrophota bacterium]
MAQKRAILIVDDDPIMRKSLLGALKAAKGYVVETAQDGEDALVKISRQFFDLVITDMKMPKMGGLELLRRIRAEASDTTVIVMTAFGTVETAVEAMKTGAYDYLTKPFSVDQVEVVVQKAIEHRMVVAENRYLRREIEAAFNFGQIVGTSAVMQRIYEVIAKVSASDATILVQGESGTGKELIARAVHFNSSRRNGPFIKVNCAALSSGLLESELFGHEKGAFTSAYTRRQGRFELADQGTLLLDEISEMDVELQAKLLRVLQEGEFDRVGGSETIKTDVRIIATTNRNLKEEIKHKRFREDLYYRLNVIPLTLPPLRERREDIPLLAQHFLEKHSGKNGRRQLRVSAAAAAMLRGYDWPGNVRELENTIERAVVLSSADTLDAEQFTFLAACSGAASEMPAQVDGAPAEPLLPLNELEKRAIYAALEQCQGNKTRAAELLGVTVRTMRNKVKQFYQEDARQWGKFFLETAAVAEERADLEPVAA